MPAIEALIRPDVNTPTAPAGGNHSSSAPAGSAPGGMPFGDVLSNSINSNPAADKTSDKSSDRPVAKPHDKSAGQPPVGTPAPADNSSAKAAPAEPSPPAKSDSNSDSTAKSESTAVSDAQTQLAAEVAAAQSAPVQPVPVEPAAAKSAETAPPVTSVPGAPPAQLANQLSQSGLAAVNALDPTTVDSQTADSQSSPAQAPSGTGAAPQAFLAGLVQTEALNSTPSASDGAAGAADSAKNQTPQAIATSASATAVAVKTTPIPPLPNVAVSSTQTVVANTGAATASTNAAAASNATTPGTQTETPAPAISLASTVIDATGPNSQGSAQSDAGSQSNSSFGSTNAANTGPTSGLNGPSVTASFAASLTAQPTAASSAATEGPSAISPLSAAHLEAGSAGETAATGSAQQTGLPTPGQTVFGSAPTSLQLQGTTLAAEQQVSATSNHAAGVVNQVAYAIQYTHSSGQGMQLHLTPPELGAVQVDVSVRDGVLSARLEAQTQSTQQILTDNLPALKESLSQQGVAFDRIDVRLAGADAGSGGPGNPNPSLAQQQQQQQDGALPWDQQFNQQAADDVAITPAAATARNSRAPLTALDIMV